MHLGGLPGLLAGLWYMVSECEMHIFLWSASEEPGEEGRNGGGAQSSPLSRLGKSGGETDGRTAACNGMQLRSAVCSLWGTRRGRYDASSKRISNHESPQPSLLSPLLMCVSPPLCLFPPSLHTCLHVCDCGNAGQSTGKSTDCF